MTGVEEVEPWPEEPDLVPITEREDPDLEERREIAAAPPRRLWADEPVLTAAGALVLVVVPLILGVFGIAADMPALASLVASVTTMLLAVGGWVARSQVTPAAHLQ